MAQKMIYGELLGDQLRQVAWNTHDSVTQDQYYQMLDPWIGPLVERLSSELHDGLVPFSLRNKITDHRWYPYLGPLATRLIDYAAEGRTSCYYNFDLSAKLTGKAMVLRQAHQAIENPAGKRLILGKLASWLSVMTDVEMEWWGVDPVIEFGAPQEIKKGYWEALYTFQAEVQLHW